MEDILELYCLPYDSNVPLVCMDEQPCQLIKETRIPLPAIPGKPQRVDYEYERNGTANIFLFVEPLAGWRHVNVRERRTRPTTAQANPTERKPILPFVVIVLAPFLFVERHPSGAPATICWIHLVRRFSALSSAEGSEAFRTA